MTDEERDIITRFIERVGGGQPATGSAPATPLPPVDPEADRLIGELFAKYPEARYRLAQMAFVQEHALAEAQNRIARLQYELQQARQAQTQAPPAAQSPWGAAAQAPQPQPQPQPQQSRGLFGGLFGGGQSAPPPQQPQYQQPQYQQPPQQPQYAPPPPQYAQGYQPGMFQRQGSGFLGSALTTAAGVAGGMVAGNALMNMFSGNHGGGMFGNAGFGGGESQQAPEVVEYVPAPPDAGWSDASSPGPDPYAGGGGWQDTSASDNGGWTDSDSGGDSGWDSGNDDIQNV
jgi:uncharacterized protein